MALSYDELLQAEQKRATRQQEQYAAARRQEAERQIHETAAAMAKETAAKTSTYERQLQQLPTGYTASYSKNGVAKAVRQRRLKERLANLGLTGSGLQKAEERGARQQQRLADRAVQEKMTAEQSELQQALETALAALRAKQEQQAAGIRAKAEKEIAANETALYKAAQTSALNQYKEESKKRR